MNIITQYCTYEEKIQKSTFIAHLFPVNTWQEAKEKIALINQEHKNATHNCWAYIVGDKGEISHSSDAGEPAGTAGKPILNALLKHQMTHCVAIVTRYFGGVKLGVRGLIEAYGGITDLCLQNSPLLELIFKKKYQIITSYDFYNILKHKLIIDGLEITETSYTDKITLRLELNQSSEQIFRSIVQEYHNAGKIELIEGSD